MEEPLLTASSIKRMSDLHGDDLLTPTVVNFRPLTPPRVRTVAVYERTPILSPITSLMTKVIFHALALF